LQTPLVLGSLPTPLSHLTGHAPTSSSSDTATHGHGQDGKGGHYL
jgi:hypothetical protein